MMIAISAIHRASMEKKKLSLGSCYKKRTKQKTKNISHYKIQMPIGFLGLLSINTQLRFYLFAFSGPKSSFRISLKDCPWPWVILTT